MDYGEPNISTRPNEWFAFKDMESGSYLMREIVPDGCHQLYPGINGSSFWIPGDGYVDIVNDYYHHGHSKFISPHGGIIGQDKVYKNDDFSFILKNDNNTYLSLYPDYNITLGFIDETIWSHTLTNDDIVFNIYGESTTGGHVSISQDNINFFYIGTVNSSHTSFNTALISHFDRPVSHIRIHFFGLDKDDPLNIVSIKAKKFSLTSPQYSYSFELPGYYINLFYNDCNYYFDCETYCYYRSADYDSYHSCNYGCSLFDKNKNCYCEDYPIDGLEYDGNVFNNDGCNNAVSYTHLTLPTKA